MAVNDAFYLEPLFVWKGIYMCCVGTFSCEFQTLVIIGGKLIKLVCLKTNKVYQLPPIQIYLLYCLVGIKLAARSIIGESWNLKWKSFENFPFDAVFDFGRRGSSWTSRWRWEPNCMILKLPWKLVEFQLSWKLKSWKITSSGLKIEEASKSRPFIPLSSFSHNH